MKLRRFLPATIVLLLGLTACSNTGSPGDAASSEDLTTVKVAAAPGGVMPVSFRAAVEAGIFENEGLDVQVQDVATGTDGVAAITQGGTDIAYSDLFAGATSIQNGFDIGLVTPFNGNTGEPGTRREYFLVKSDGPLASVSDLESKKIAVGAPPLFKTFASVILREEGVDPKSVEWVVVPDQTTFESVVATGAVDAAYTPSVINGAKWTADGDVRAVGDPEKLAENINTVESAVAGFWSSQTWYEQNPETAEKFTRAITETSTWYPSLSTEERAAYVKDQTGADLIELDETYPGLLKTGVSESFTPAPINEELVAAWFEVGAEYADIPEIPFEDLLLPSSQDK